MARKASSKPDSGSSSTATIGFGSFVIQHSSFDITSALPGQLFSSTQIPVCLWFLAKNTNADAKRGFRGRRKQTLFIDARKMGTLIDRVHRVPTNPSLN